MADYYTHTVASECIPLTRQHRNVLKLFPFMDVTESGLISAIDDFTFLPLGTDELFNKEDHKYPADDYPNWLPELLNAEVKNGYIDVESSNITSINILDVLSLIVADLKIPFIHFSWAHTCSRPIAGSFGGGEMLIFADGDMQPVVLEAGTLLQEYKMLQEEHAAQEPFIPQFLDTDGEELPVSSRMYPTLLAKMLRDWLACEVEANGPDFNVEIKLVPKQSAKIVQEPMPTVCVCGNCSKSWSMSELNPIEDLDQRVAAGEIMPAGECPDCGCLCHLERSISLAMRQNILPADYTRCVNDRCIRCAECARHQDHIPLNNTMLFSFCHFPLNKGHECDCYIPLNKDELSEDKKS